MDDVKFTPKEVVKVAVEIEKRGREFYSSLVNRFKDPGVQDIFRKMTIEETKHEQLFNGFLENFSEYKIKKAFSRENAKRMEALAGSHIFAETKKITESLQNISTPVDAINLAIEFEKDSVVYFTGMKEYVFEDESGVIDSLAKEEMLHVVRLLDLKNEILKTL